MTESSEGVSFTISFDEVHEHKLEALILRTGVKDLSELIKESMTLFDWAVGQVESGKRIASYDTEKNRVLSDLGATSKFLPTSAKVKPSVCTNRTASFLNASAS